MYLPFVFLASVYIVSLLFGYVYSLISLYHLPLLVLSWRSLTVQFVSVNILITNKIVYNLKYRDKPLQWFENLYIQ